MESSSGNEPTFLPLECGTTPEKYQLKAEKELHETEERRENCLKEMRVMIKREKNLNSRSSDEFLLQFLRAKKFDTRVAFRTLQKFYMHRLNYPSVYRDFSPKRNLKVLNSGVANFLPFRNPEGSAIWVVRTNLWDVEAFTFEELLRFGLLCNEKELQNPLTQICGMVSIVDLKGLSWSNLFHMPPDVMKCFVKASQDCLPIRHKAIHVINNPSIFGFLFAIIRPFLSYKIRSRIHFHGENVDSLHQFLPPAMLPEEFGGTRGPFENEAFYARLLDSEEEFLQNEKFGYSVQN